MPPIGLVKIQDDELEATRHALRGLLQHLQREIVRLHRVLKNLDAEAVQRGHILLMPYEPPPDYYPDEHSTKQHQREVEAHRSQQWQRYLAAGYAPDEKGRVTWDSRLFEAFVLSQIVRPRKNGTEIATTLKVTRQRVAQMVDQAAELLGKEQLPSLPRGRPRNPR
jgi:hypothetical protein